MISKFPEIGTKTDFQGVRVKVVRNYKIFYSNHEDRIEIIRVWDAKRDPASLKIDDNSHASNHLTTTTHQNPILLS